MRSTCCTYWWSSVPRGNMNFERCGGHLEENFILSSRGMVCDHNEVISRQDRALLHTSNISLDHTNAPSHDRVIWNRYFAQFCVGSL
jgi:hypothetical protein